MSQPHAPAGRPAAPPEGQRVPPTLRTPLRRAQGLVHDDYCALTTAMHFHRAGRLDLCRSAELRAVANLLGPFAEAVLAEIQRRSRTVDEHHVLTPEQVAEAARLGRAIGGGR